jgi:hypothetical protein
VDAGRPELEIGGGELAFEPLAEDATLPFVRGGQGGTHVYVSFRERGLLPKRIAIEVTTTISEDPELVLSRRGRVGFEPESGDGGAGERYVFPGWPAEMIEAAEHVGESVVVAVTLTDTAGMSAHAEKSIVIAPTDRPPEGE